MPVEKITMYRCSFCQTLYGDEDDANKCLSKGWNPLFSPGDIVVTAGSEGFVSDSYVKQGIYDKPGSWAPNSEFCSFGEHAPIVNDLWVYKKGKGLHDRPGVALYFVVGYVGNRKEMRGTSSEAHDPVYHLFSEARYINDNGWTSNDHVIFKKPAFPPPKELIEASKKYIGKRTQDLLNIY